MFTAVSDVSAAWRSATIAGSITDPTPPVKEPLRELVLQAIRSLQNDAVLPADLALPGFVIERARSREQIGRAHV